MNFDRHHSFYIVNVKNGYNTLTADFFINLLIKFKVFSDVYTNKNLIILKLNR